MRAMVTVGYMSRNHELGWKLKIKIDENAHRYDYLGRAWELEWLGEKRQGELASSVWKMKCQAPETR